jgi:hypothetical protein
MMKTVRRFMEIQNIDSYTEHGCNIRPYAGYKLAVIDYYDDVTNHEFNSAHSNGGIYEKLDEAKQLAANTYGEVIKKLEIPDFVFMYKDRE